MPKSAYSSIFERNFVFISLLGSFLVHASLTLPYFLLRDGRDVKLSSYSVTLYENLPTSTAGGQHVSPEPKTLGRRVSSNSGQSLSPRSNDEKQELNSSQNKSEFRVSLPYPQASRLLGEEGEVIFHLDSNRKSYQQTQSSGFQRLDQAALEFLSEKRNLKAFDFDGQKIRKIRFVFQLKDPSPMLD